jgi:hypothetical protein
MLILSVFLIVLGTLAFVYQGFTVWTRQNVIDAGPLQVDVNKPQTLWISPLVAAGLVVTGVFLLLFI